MGHLWGEGRVRERTQISATLLARLATWAGRCLLSCIEVHTHRHGQTILPFLLMRPLWEGFPVDEHVVDLATKLAFDLFHDVLELGLLLLGQVVWLQNTSVPLHFVGAFMWSNLWLMNRSHTWFLFQQVHDSFFRVRSWANFLRCAIHHVFVDGAHMEPLVFAKCAAAAL